MALTIPEPDPDGSLSRWVSVLVPASQLADRIADTDFVPRSLRNKPGAVTAAILYGDELGIGPMQALAGIAVVDGRPYLSAQLMRAVILRNGHTLTVHSLSGTMARVSGLRVGEPESARVTIEWTLDMARAAGLLTKDNWRKYPRAMLLARATSDLARLLFPDALAGFGEIDDDSAPSVAQLSGWAATVPDEAPETPRTRVSRKALPKHRKTELATEAHPAPDGSVDVPLPNVADEQAHAAAMAATDAKITRREQRDAARVSPTTDSAPAASQSSGPPARNPSDSPMGPGQRRATFAALKQAGIDPEDREARLIFARLVLGRSVDSYRELTRGESYRLVRVATDVATGALVYGRDENGDLTLNAIGEEPSNDEQ
jgi:hypothetical protein